MNNFTVTLQTSIGLRVFYFRPVNSVNGILYHVTVFGTITNNYFLMMNINGSWDFGKRELVPGWVLIAEKEFKELVAQYI